MSHLATDLRNLLERTVVEARDVAELGARAALEALSVGEGKVPAHLKPEERDLRVRLRARARQLGDPLDAKTQVQAVDHLVLEVAYEHWHRMLFARFLAESHLLVEPGSGVAVSLDECRQLARARGEEPWALAGRFAERMLPAIFRSNDPALALQLPPERLNRLEALLESLLPEVFAADDALGWAYQFWQSKRKKEVNASGRKIGADELPAVTQLFTEPFMVQFLLHNTLGAWHAGKVLTARPELATSAASEEDLRRACALPGYEWPYLRFVRDPAGPWRPVAGAFPGWPPTALEVTFIDPCCGSGHFLVEALSALVALRQHEESLDLPAAVRAVLTDNLYGLEIDPRCTQIAAFAVGLTAWKKIGHFAVLPAVQIACTGLPVSVPLREWQDLAGEVPELRRGMERLWTLYRDAPILGSLLEPANELSADLFSASLEPLEAHLRGALEREVDRQDPSSFEVGVTASGLTRATDLLLRRYVLIATNPPYLVRGKQIQRLRDWLTSRYSRSSADLATVVLERICRLLCVGGTQATVTPQNWLLIKSYAKLRTYFLSECCIDHVARVGSGATATASWDVLRALSIISQVASPETQTITGLASAAATEEGRAKDLLCAEVACSTKRELMQGPDRRFAIGAALSVNRLESEAASLQGTSTGDYPRYGRKFWEVAFPGETWILQQTSVGESALFAGRENALCWENGKGALAASTSAAIRGLDALGKRGVAVTQTRGLAASLFDGEFFDNNIAVLLPLDEKHRAALYCYCSSPEFGEEVRRLDEKLGVTNATLGKVPFDLAHWEVVARERYPGGLPEPWSEDPTQWIFHGHSARAGSPLQVGVARLLGHQWPAELDSTMRLSNEAREWVKRAEALVGLADRDGIVCLDSLRQEESAAVRLRGLLAAAFGKEWSAIKERELLAVTPGQSASLEEWLRVQFFEEHCTLFHQRPFIWHLWDGRKDGFHALVNYHRLAEGNGKGRQLLDKLAHDYLGEWIERQRRSAAAGETGAEARLVAAVELQGELKKILEGEEPYDIFVRWKPLRQQAIGWDPDIDDGVRLNARPFLTATLSSGRAGAGLFRAKPNIHWKKDRGAEPQRNRADFPWFYDNGGRFHGERHNDRHLSLDEKRRARESKAKGGATP